MTGFVPFNRDHGSHIWHARIGRVTMKTGMGGNVVSAGIVTSLDIPPSRVLAGALDANLTDVVVIGYTQDGDEFFSSSMADGGTVLWLAEKMKASLLSVTIPERALGPEPA
mgnify:CR=1 FL=1